MFRKFGALAVLVLASGCDSGTNVTVANAPPVKVDNAPVSKTMPVMPKQAPAGGQAGSPPVDMSTYTGSPVTK